MNFLRMFGSAVIRKLGYLAAAALVALVLTFFGMGKANAQSYPDCTNPAKDGSTNGSVMCATFDDAYAAAQSIAQAKNTHGWQISEPNTKCTVSVMPVGSSYGGTWLCTYRNAYGNGTINRRYMSGSCAARNADLGGVNQPERSLGYGKGASDQCNAGCKYKLVSGERTETATFSMEGKQPESHTKIWGKWEYTGDACVAPQNEPVKPKVPVVPETNCAPAYEGVSICDRPADNKTCMTMGDGRFGCWSKNEFGQKTDGPTTQIKTDSPTPPNSPEGSDKKVTATTNSNNKTTNITNYTTNNGSPAGPSNQGEKGGAGGAPGAPGSGSGAGGNGDNPDPNGGNSSGDCGAAPQSVGDALLGAILKQEWETGCKVEKASGKLEGDPNCNDGGVVAFNCSGNQLICKNALLALEAKCQALDEKNRIISDGEKDQGNGPEELELWGDGTGGDGFTPNGSILVSGGTGEFVPVMTLAGSTVDLNGVIGNLLAILKALIIACCSVWAAFVAGGRK